MARKRTVQPPPNPIGEEHLDALRMLLASCHETEALCEQCRQCNINVGPEAQANAGQAQMAQDIIKTFFPNATNI